MKKTFEEAALEQVKGFEALEKSLKFDEDFEKKKLSATNIQFIIEKDSGEEIIVAAIQSFRAKEVQPKVIWQMGTLRNDNHLEPHIEGSFIPINSYLPHETLSALIEHQDQVGYLEGKIIISETEDNKLIKQTIFPNVFLSGVSELHAQDTYRFSSKLPEEKECTTQSL